MIESMGITRSSSNCDSSEWGCSSTSKQPTLQHNHHTAGMENTEAVPSVPGDMDRPCAHSPAQLSGTTGHKTRPVPAPKRWQLQPGCPAMGRPRAISQAAGPGGMQHARGEERGWTLHHLPDHRTSMPGCTHPSVGSSWAALGACWAQEPFRQGPVWLSPAQLALLPSHHSLCDIREALK